MRAILYYYTYKNKCEILEISLVIILLSILLLLAVVEMETCYNYKEYMYNKVRCV